jgi:hypothetical protein
MKQTILMTELEKCELARAKGYTYNPITGELINKKGVVLNKKRKDGYSVLAIYTNACQYEMLGHRYAWYFHYGKLPNNCIDHIDGNPSNNKIENLRDVTKQQNSFNQIKAKGYRWNKREKKFVSYLQVDGRLKHLGYHTNEEEARNAYIEGKKKYHVIPQ